MKRALVLSFGLMLVCGIALASVGIRGSTGPIMVATDIYFGSGFDSSTVDGTVYNAISSVTSATPAITGGTINGATVGVSSAVAGNFSTIGVTTPGTGKFTSVASNATIGAYKLAVDGAVYFKPSSLTAAAAGGSRLGLNTDGSIYIY